MEQKTQYEILGVSASKEEVHNAIRKLDPGLFPSAFCKAYPDNLTGSKEHCIIGHTDGAGTKSSLAYLYWKETGDINIFRNLAHDAIAMNLDDLLCVGALGPYTFTQTIDRNKFLITEEVLEAIIDETQAFFEKMRTLYDIDITYNGGETADVNDTVRTLVLNASMVTRMLRSDFIDTTIAPGKVIIGLSSSEQASYENEYNSGIGSNGITMEKHKLFWNMYRVQYPETYDNTIIKNAYTGKYPIATYLPEMGTTVGKLALSPTRTYTPIVKEVLKNVPKEKLSALIHCSGAARQNV